MNIDIAAKIGLYSNLPHIIKIKIHNTRYLLSSVVNIEIEIEIIPACFLSAHALSQGWEGGVRAVTTEVGWWCWQWAWRLKYIICVIFKPLSAQSVFAFLCVPLCALCSSYWNAVQAPPANYHPALRHQGRALSYIVVQKIFIFFQYIMNIYWYICTILWTA